MPSMVYSLHSKGKEMDINHYIKEGVSLSELIDYHSDGVVSKTVIQKETGTLTLFAFDQGQSLSEHTAPYDAFVYIMDGVANITIEGNSYTVSEGEILIMPANKPHALKADQRFKMMLVMIKE